MLANQICQKFLDATYGQELAELEMASPIFDRDEPEEKPKNRYLILSTPRSGSYWLCRQLWHAGLGLPFEYLNSFHMRRFTKRWKADLGEARPGNNQPRYWEEQISRIGAKLGFSNATKKQPDIHSYLEITEKKRSMNGWMGLKAQPIHLKELDICFESIFQNWAIIPLLRRDQRRQLASYLFARVSGAYDLGLITSTTGDSLSRLNEPSLIHHMAELLASQNKAILQIARSRNLQPLWMEDLLGLDSDILQERIVSYLPGAELGEHLFTALTRRQDPFFKPKQAMIEEISMSIPTDIVLALEQSLNPD